jgi:hypothetical protein
MEKPRSTIEDHQRPADFFADDTGHEALKGTDDYYATRITAALHGRPLASISRTSSSVG